ncbi:hypothetical protein GJAV_G00199260 [Gymnothorax javanicus]|nr:hypothetical protein GJAV_G00199260 [Gymnothorax javanicus]
MAANRASGALLQDSTNCSDGLLGPAPMGLQRGGMNSNWGAATSNQRQPFSGSPKIRSRVVVAKFAGTPLTLDSLLVLAQPFGTVCEHLVLNNKAFLEMRTHEEALAMANFYQWKPAVVHGKEITIYVSQELMRIEKGNRDSGGGPSRVVFFSNLPKEREDKMELLTLARRFGTLEKYLFLTDQAFLQLGTPEDAETMVKYYTLHPLTIKGRKIQLNVCEKYKTLVVKPFRNLPTREREDTNRKGSSSSRKGSPKRRRSESSSEKSSKSKAERSKKEKDVEPEAEGSTVLGEVSGDEISGVIEAGGDDYDESADKQEGEQAEIPDEAMMEPGESSTQEVESVPDIDETQTVEEGSEVPPTAESKKTVVDNKAAPAEGGVASEDLGRQESANSTEPTESTQMSTEEREEDQARNANG